MCHCFNIFVTLFARWSGSKNLVWKSRTAAFSDVFSKSTQGRASFSLRICTVWLCKRKIWYSSSNDQPSWKFHYWFTKSCPGHTEKISCYKSWYQSHTGICCAHDFMPNNPSVNKNREILPFTSGPALPPSLLRSYNNCKHKIAALDAFDAYDNSKINCLVCLR